MRNIIMLENDVYFNDWSGKANDLGSESAWRLIQGNNHNVYIINAGKSIRENDVICYLLQKMLSINKITPDVIAIHQSIIRDISNFSYNNAVIYEYSFGHRYVTKAGTQSSDGQPTIENKTIYDVLTEKLYNLLPVFFTAAEEKAESQQKESSISSMQLHLSAMVLLMKTHNDCQACVATLANKLETLPDTVKTCEDLDKELKRLISPALDMNMVEKVIESAKRLIKVLEQMKEDIQSEKVKSEVSSGQG